MVFVFILGFVIALVFHMTLWLAVLIAIGALLIWVGLDGLMNYLFRSKNKN